MKQRSDIIVCVCVVWCGVCVFLYLQKSQGYVEDHTDALKINTQITSCRGGVCVCMCLCMRVCVCLADLTQQQVDDMEDHVKRELGCEESEEPLRGIHVGLQTHVHEVVVQVGKIFLFKETRVKRERREHTCTHVCTHTCMSLSSWKNLQCRSSKFCLKRSLSP